MTKSVVGMFCEDIRAEKSGAFTLVGIMPDNVRVPVAPTPDQHGMIPKLCVYIRINLDSATPIKTISTKVHLPDGNVLDLGNVAPNIIEKAFEGTLEKGSPLATIVLRAEFPAFPVTTLGRIFAKVTVDDEEFIAAQLKLASGPETNDPAVEDVRHYSQMIKVGGPTTPTEPPPS